MKQIVVVLDSLAQVDQVAPYLSDVVQPGIEIEFLIYTKPRRSAWLQAHITALSTDNSRAVEICEQEWRFDVAQEKYLAERKLAPLREALLSQGCKNELSLYTGSLKRALSQLRERQPGLIIVLRPRKSSLLERKILTILRKVGLRVSADVSKASLAFASRSSGT